MDPKASFKRLQEAEEPYAPKGSQPAIALGTPYRAAAPSPPYMPRSNSGVLDTIRGIGRI